MHHLCGSADWQIGTTKQTVPYRSANSATERSSELSLHKEEDRTINKQTKRTAQMAQTKLTTDLDQHELPLYWMAATDKRLNSCRRFLSYYFPKLYDDTR